MEVADVRKIIESVIDENENISTFDQLFRQFSEADAGQETEPAREIWDYMRRNRYLPEHLNAEDDRNLAFRLEEIAVNGPDTEPLKYALVLLHHRFMLSDILEKAFTAKMVLFFLLYNRQLILSILDETIQYMTDDPLYQDCFDPSDQQATTLLMELARAVFPFVTWMQQHYKYDEMPWLEEKIQTLLQNYSEEARKYKKPALTKFTAVCRCLNEMIHAAPQPTDG